MKIKSSRNRETNQTTKYLWWSVWMSRSTLWIKYHCWVSIKMHPYFWISISNKFQRQLLMISTWIKHEREGIETYMVLLLRYWIFNNYVRENFISKMMKTLKCNWLQNKGNLRKFHISTNVGNFKWYHGIYFGKPIIVGKVTTWTSSNTWWKRNI